MVSYPQLHVKTRVEWRAWLGTHHTTAPGIWLVTWKKATGLPRPSYDDVVEEALCAGWVDSLPRRLDTDRSQLLVTPRKPRSNWSRTNKLRVERLTTAGLMLPAGLAVVAAAKADGSWNALDEVETLTEPPELTAALDAEPAARAAWDTFPPSTRRAILEWISNAKTPDTRHQRMKQTVAEAAVGRRANQWRQPRTPEN